MKFSTWYKAHALALVTTVFLLNAWGSFEYGMALWVCWAVFVVVFPYIGERWCWFE